MVDRPGCSDFRSLVGILAECPPSAHGPFLEQNSATAAKLTLGSAAASMGRIPMGQAVEHSCSDCTTAAEVGVARTDVVEAAAFGNSCFERTVAVSLAAAAAASLAAANNNSEHKTVAPVAAAIAAEEEADVVAADVAASSYSDRMAVVVARGGDAEKTEEARGQGYRMSSPVSG